MVANALRTVARSEETDTRERERKDESGALMDSCLA
jgi:hypothetical protein